MFSGTRISISIFYKLNQVFPSEFSSNYISSTLLTIHRNLTPLQHTRTLQNTESPKISDFLAAPMASFNSVDAEIALMVFCRDVRSKSKDQKPANLLDPIPLSTRTAIVHAVKTSTEFKDNTPLSQPPAYTIDVAHFLLNNARIDHIRTQILVVSIPKVSEGTDGNTTRQLVWFTVPIEVAKQLLLLSVSPAPAGALPDYTETQARDELLSICGQSSPSNSNTLFLTPENAMEQVIALPNFDNSLRKLLEFPIARDAIKIMLNSPALSSDEVTVAGKLLYLFACTEPKQLYAEIGFSESEFLTAHKLLDRFVFSKNQGPAAYEFTPDDVASAHQLRDLFDSENPTSPFGPIYLAFPDSTGKLRSGYLCDSKDATAHLMRYLLDPEEVA